MSSPCHRCRLAIFADYYHFYKRRRGSVSTLTLKLPNIVALQTLPPPCSLLAPVRSAGFSSRPLAFIRGGFACSSTPPVRKKSFTPPPPLSLLSRFARP